MNLSVFERAIEETRESNQTLKEAVAMLHAAIFGRPDADPDRALPGIQENVQKMRAQIEGLERQLFEAKIQLGFTSGKVDALRWWIGGGMAAATAILGVVDVYVRTTLR